jgi:thiamine-phosphate pyrophosphorylase
VNLRGLYAITPEGAHLERKLRAALEGGVACVQYRRKGGNAAEAAAVVRLCREFSVPVIINDDVALALEVDADGAHLGRDDGDLGAARERLGRRILGVSCYNELERAHAAVAAGADYVAFGSVFTSLIKPAAVRAPLALFGEAASLGVPLAAIGGITVENAPPVVRAGASLLAVISDLFDAPDVRARARQYGRLFA